MARNGSARRRESGVRRHFPKARLVPPWPRCLTGYSAGCPRGKTRGRTKKPNPTRYTSDLGELLPLLRRIVGKGRLRPPPRAGRRGLPPKTWRQRCPSKGKRYHQGALPRWAPSPHRAHQRASPPSSCKQIVNLKVLCSSEIHNQDSSFAVRLAALLNRVRLRGIFLRR